MGNRVSKPRPETCQIGYFRFPGARSKRCRERAMPGSTLCQAHKEAHLQRVLQMPAQSLIKTQRWGAWQ